MLSNIVRKLNTRSTRPRIADILVDGWWGSSGKGNVASALARRMRDANDPYTLFVSQNGPNAGHTTVVDGQRVVWKVLPSACAADPTANVLLGPSSIFSRERLEEEAARITGSIYVHSGATILTADDAKKEQENPALVEIASTCQGTAAAMWRKISRSRAINLQYLPNRFAVVDTPDMLDLIASSHVLHEVAQGVMLSIDHGDYPWTTSRNCTAQQAVADMLYDEWVTIAVYRSLPIRVGNHHGFSGPMPDEIDWRTVATTSGIPHETLVKNEQTTVTGRLRRVSRPTVAALERSLAITRPHYGVVTFADYGDGFLPWYRTRFEADGVRLLASSTGPTPADFTWWL